MISFDDYPDIGSGARPGRRGGAQAGPHTARQAPAAAARACRASGRRGEGRRRARARARRTAVRTGAALRSKIKTTSRIHNGWAGRCARAGAAGAWRRGVPGGRPPGRQRHNGWAGRCARAGAARAWRRGVPGGRPPGRQRHNGCANRAPGPVRRGPGWRGVPGGRPPGKQSLRLPPAMAARRRRRACRCEASTGRDILAARCAAVRARRGVRGPLPRWMCHLQGRCQGVWGSPPGGRGTFWVVPGRAGSSPAGGASFRGGARAREPFGIWGVSAFRTASTAPQAVERAGRAIEDRVRLRPQVQLLRDPVVSRRVRLAAPARDPRRGGLAGWRGRS